MSEVKRYDPTTRYIGTGDYVGEMEPENYGDYVSFDDYYALRPQIASLEAKLERANKWLTHYPHCSMNPCTCGLTAFLE
jgi:hypothetical protein